LGQASVLTITANGIDTSPVVRGVWVLENILGTPPAPPPPDVPALEPDIRGATTIRDQLRKHRDTPACYECHRKIDPPGFALENFDPIGRWRTTYSGRRAVDASGELSNGTAFEDVVGLKKALLERQGQFTRALAEKLTISATGRALTPADRLGVSTLADEVGRQGGGLADLVQRIATSETFQAK
jgi:hypothetical protein